MRLISSISKDEPGLNAYAFSYYLTSLNIRNEVEEVPSSFGIGSFRIWIYDEDDVSRAMSLFDEYKRNPKDPKFHARYENPQELKNDKSEPLLSVDEEEGDPKRKNRILSPAPYGPLSLIILFITIALFIWSHMGKKEYIPPNISGVVAAPILSPIEKKLLYDYPLYFQIRDRLLTIYTPEDIKEKKPPSREAISLIEKLKATPVWTGIYDKIVTYFQKGQKEISTKAPLFEKIREGEIWRLLTPAFLHFGLLHIFFNLLWFILLGNQIEYRIGKLRYLFLIIAVAIISNTAQYLMSGPFFMGLSGIVVGMAGFIFARQQVAPWEGYLLHRFTLMFLAIFVVGMFVIQTALFFLQVFANNQFTIGIANTAHLIGGIVGYICGRMRLFSLQHHWRH